jgi:CRP/FNR family transcriptional regulator, cyclic AMP receptor protein
LDFNDLLAGLEPADRVRILDAAHEAEFAVDETIIEEQTENRAIFVLLDGCVEVVGGAPTLAHPERTVSLATLEIGNFFGEMSFLTGERPSTSVVARSHTRMLVLDHHYLAQVMQSEPALAAKFYLAVATTLAHRLGRANQSAVDSGQ